MKATYMSHWDLSCQYSSETHVQVAALSLLKKQIDHGEWKTYRTDYANVE
jgi:hypothetical protein